MKLNLLTYNDIENVTKIIVNNNIEGLFEFCSKYNNIIELLLNFKNTLFENKETISVNISVDNFKGDVILDRKDSLVNLPQDEIHNVIVSNLNLKIGYPVIKYENFELNKLTCIKSVDGFDLKDDDIIQLIESMPIAMYKEVHDYIENNVISKLNNVYLYYTKNELYRNKFEFTLEGIINLFVTLCKYDIEYLTKIKLILIKEGNFNLLDFNHITVEQANIFYKLLKELYDESDK